MGFVDDMPTRRLDVPDEEGAWFEVRMLSWKELEECRREASRKSLAAMRDMGPDIIRAVGEMEHGADPDAAAAVQAAREANERVREEFDRESLVTKSVVGWSYERRFQQTLLGKLDEATFSWLFEAIVAMYTGDDAQRKAVFANSSSA